MNDDTKNNPADNNKGEQESPLEFPCDFPIKVMGATEGLFRETCLDIVRTHIPTFKDQHISERTSSNNKYLSLTLTVHVTSREQLDAIYRELHACGHVLMSL